MKASLSKLSIWHVALAILGVILSPRPASADLLWSWSYRCSLLETQTKCQGGSGTFTTTAQQGSGSSTYYTVYDMTGTVEGNTVTSVLAPGSLGKSNDNRIDSFGSPQVYGPGKITGIGFLTNNDPATDANANLLFSNYIDNVVGSYTQISGPSNLALLNVSFSGKITGEVDPAGEPVAVPEPGNLLYTALGILALGFVVRKKLPGGEIVQTCRSASHA